MSSLSGRDSSGRVVSLLCGEKVTSAQDSGKPDIREVSYANPE